MRYGGNKGCELLAMAGSLGKVNSIWGGETDQMKNTSPLERFLKRVVPQHLDEGTHEERKTIGLPTFSGRHKLCNCGKMVEAGLRPESREEQEGSLILLQNAKR